MSYIPTLWQTGDIITANKLNNMENGIVSANSGEPFLITFIYHDDPLLPYYTADKTLEEVSEAYNQGKWIIACEDDSEDIFQLYSHYMGDTEEYFKFSRITTSYSYPGGESPEYNFVFDNREFSFSDEGVYYNGFGVTINNVTLDWSDETTPPQSNP